MAVEQEKRRKTATYLDNKRKKRYKRCSTKKYRRKNDEKWTMAKIVLIIMGCCMIGMTAVAAVCDEGCSGSGCDYIGGGSGEQFYFNRCQNQNQCGAYDPQADSCVKICSWNTYECTGGMWPYIYTYECNHITAYREECDDLQ